MKPKRIAAIFAALVLGGVLYYLYGGHETPPGQPPLAELRAETFATIETAFNAARQDVRIVLLLSPT